MPFVEPRHPYGDCCKVEVPHQEQKRLHAPQPFWTIQCLCQGAASHELPKPVGLVELRDTWPHDGLCMTQCLKDQKVLQHADKSNIGLFAYEQTTFIKS